MPSEASPHIELTIAGMHCSGCAQGVERQLEKIGLKDVSVNYATSTARFRTTDGITVGQVIRQIEGLGYTITTDQAPVKQGTLPQSLKTKFLFCLVWTIPLFMHMFSAAHILHDPWFQLLLCVPVFTVGFLHFGRSAYSSLKVGMLNMDVLIVIGISAAFIYSLAGTLYGLGPDFLYYETAASITTIVLLGNLIEEYSVKKTTFAVEELSKIQATRAKRVSMQGGNEIISEIDSESIALGDTLLVNTGDKIPADGTIIWGEASIDEAMISGESIPVDKRTSDSVIGGTIVVQGNIKFKATAVGNNTILAGIIRLVKEAQSNKPQIQRIGDRVSAIFTPIVVSIALLTFVGSYLLLAVSFPDAMLRAIAVLVVACPCAMGLATPTAVMVGIGRAARHGILVKGGDTIEKFANIKMVIFDKTGTLTTGRFKIKNINLIGKDREYVNAIVRGLELYSSHPIAKSLNDHLRDTVPAPLERLEESRGIGISGRDKSGNYYQLGSALIAPEIKLSGHDLYLLENGVLIATIDIADEIKSDARATIDSLKQIGIQSALVSGDRKIKCDEIAASVSIDQVYCQQTPADKVKVVEHLETGKLTAFVGDGVNDAAALARAAVGISMSGATGAAIQSAQIVLLKEDLQHLLSALAISRLTLRTIKQNLFWAFFYNIIAIPFAAFGFLSPTLASIAMGFSDVITIGNSMRLKHRPLKLSSGQNLL